MRAASRIAGGIGASLILSGCFGLAALSYRGDGKLTDGGILQYASRYRIDLGPLDVTVPGVYTYRLEGMPHAEFTVGFDVLDSEPNRLDFAPKYDGRLRVELRNSAGELVVGEDSPLRDWVRSYGLGGTTSRFYRRGESKEVRLSNGNIQHQSLGVKASGGWGTYFKSEPSESYKLIVEVVEPMRHNPRPTRVTLVGWDRA